MTWGNCVRASFPPLWLSLSAVQAQAYFLPRLASTLTVWTPTVCQGGYGLPALGGHPSPSLVWVKPGITDVIGVTALQLPSDARGWGTGATSSARAPSWTTERLCFPSRPRHQWLHAQLGLRWLYVWSGSPGVCRVPAVSEPPPALPQHKPLVRRLWPSVRRRPGCGCVAL